MPKAILEFNLPEEASEFDTANKAGRLHAATWNFYNALRAYRKYGVPEEAKADPVEFIWDAFWAEFDGLVFEE